MYEHLSNFLEQVALLDWRLVALCILVVLAFVILDAALLSARKVKDSVGLSEEKQAVSIDGAKTYPVKNYVSDIQGLAGKPDAIVLENGFFIPVERKPTAKKVRDRYIAQLLVYMRLVEEFEGKKPPYGYLILGPKCKTIKIDNSEKRQIWLDEMLKEMRRYLDTLPKNKNQLLVTNAEGLVEKSDLVATPDPRKCSKCFVNKFCSWRQ